MPRSALRRPAAAALALLVACSPSAPASPSPSEGAPAANGLPFALAVRSDTPYVTGTVARRDGDGGALRLLVQAPADAPVSASRVAAALVRVHADSLLVFRDGRPASAADLTVGRAVVVWVRGPELRSLPPQVTGSAILVERR